MIKYYWQEIVHHHHDIMIPVFIIYTTALYFLGKWYLRNMLKEEMEKIFIILDDILDRK